MHFYKFSNVESEFLSWKGRRCGIPKAFFSSHLERFGVRRCILPRSVLFSCLYSSQWTWRGRLVTQPGSACTSPTRYPSVMVLGFKVLYIFIMCRRGAGDILARDKVRDESSAGIAMGDKHSFGSTIWLLFMLRHLLRRKFPFKLTFILWFVDSKMCFLIRSSPWLDLLFLNDNLF